MAKRKRKVVLVTRASLEELLSNPALRVKALGRALTILYKEQTPREQSQKATFEHNGVGFSACDAELGTRCAQHYARTGDLHGWMVDVWTKRDANGRMRIAKYHAQLNQVALAKAAVKEQIEGNKESAYAHAGKRAD
jgi:hypothetical protein